MSTNVFVYVNILFDYKSGIGGNIMKVNVVDAKKASELLENSKPMPVMSMEQIEDENTKNKEFETESEFSLDDLDR